MAQLFSGRMTFKKGQGYDSQTLFKYCITEVELVDNP